MRRIVLALVLALSAGCLPPTPHHGPIPVPPSLTRTVRVTVRAPDGSVVPDVTATLTPYDGSGSVLGTFDGLRWAFAIPTATTGGAQIDIVSRFALFDGGVVLDPDLPEIHLQPLVPPVPTREQALKVWTHGMQGLHCDTAQFGRLPWWDPALPWLTADDRQRVYACKHAVGDTHQLIALPVGRPLYDECCNAYSPDRFPALDWSQGETAFDARLADLVAEVRREGFVAVLFPNELPDHSLKDILLALDALTTSTHGDLSHHVLYMTGWDGTFYGPWTEYQLTQEWPNTIRARCPDCVLGTEFNTGHIPQEAGWNMTGFDAILVEFERGVHNCNNWQIVVRLIGEGAYRRPADDDWRLCGLSGPPYARMPMMTPRGEIQTVCFEWKTYWHVREQETDEATDSDRAYLLAEGCPAIG